ncbi:hypothetical protein D5086_015734 [Populus alba]|uniref:Uncharacterized protein n=1 Tax=Populus alba TaxID=43335 RepID=A0ACC4BSL6_POPAL
MPVTAWVRGASHARPRITISAVQATRNSQSSVKLDVDESSPGNPGRAGFGSLIRDHEGIRLKGFMGLAGVGSNLLA